MRHASPLLLIVLRRICANRSRATGAGEERRERLRYPESLRATLDDRSHIQRDQNGGEHAIPDLSSIQESPNLHWALDEGLRQ